VLKGIAIKLVNLILSYNNLTYIPPNLLSTVSILRELSLEGNILEYVNSTSFENLIRLPVIQVLFSFWLTYNKKWKNEIIKQQNK
jgi:hypothetical protein